MKQDLQSRLEFIGLDATALGHLANARPHIEAHLVPALETFYAKISSVPAVSRFFEGKSHMKRAEDKQVGHWGSIAAGQFDDTYFDSSTRVGLRHAKIGLEPRWHIGGYGVIMEGLVRGVLHDAMAEALKPTKGRFGRSQPRAAEDVLADADALAESLVAVLKAILLDIDIGVSAYFEKLTEESRAADEAARAKIQKAVGATGAVLQMMARGDLTGRIRDDLDAEFEQIKDDTNAVADQFSDIVSRLRQTSRSLRTATGEILSGANDLADRTTRQAATIEETTASLEQLSMAVVENAKRAATASDQAQALARSATAGGEAMNEANGP